VRLKFTWAGRPSHSQTHGLAARATPKPTGWQPVPRQARDIDTSGQELTFHSHKLHMNTRNLSLLLALLLAAIVISLSGCVPVPVKGKIRTDVDASPPSGNTVVAIKPTTAYNNKVITRDELKPLVEAVAKLDRNMGCWASTIEIITEPVGGETTKTIYHSNPSKPPKEMIDLVLVKNLPPTDEQRAAVAERTLKAYDAFLKSQDSPRPSRRKQRTWAKRLETEVALGSCYMETVGDNIKYTILTKSDRIEYVVAPATGTIVEHNEINLAGMKIRGIALSANFEVDESYDRFAYMPEQQVVLPVMRKRVVKQTAQALGKRDDANQTTIYNYSDYRKVTCYNDRLTVILGELSVIDE